MAFLCDGGWLLSGIAYYSLLFITGEWRRLAPESWSIIPGAWHSFLEYASFHLVETPGAYNPLQQLSYFGIVFIIAPLTIATGVAMSPSITGRFPWYLKVFGGRQPARSIHFLCMLAFTGFIIMHVLMVVLHGFGRELALIVLGQTNDPNIPIALLIGCLGLFAVFVLHVVRHSGVTPSPTVRAGHDWNNDRRRAENSVWPFGLEATLSRGGHLTQLQGEWQAPSRRAIPGDGAEQLCRFLP